MNFTVSDPICPNFSNKSMTVDHPDPGLLVDPSEQEQV